MTTKSVSMTGEMRTFLRALRWPVAALLALLLATVAGCTTEMPRHLWRVAITPSVPAEQEAIIIDAVQAWETAVPGLRFTVVHDVYASGDPSTIWISGDDVPSYGANECLGHTRLVGTDRSSQVNIPREGWRLAVLKHELGHAMELRHQPCGIMGMQSWDATDAPIERCDTDQYRQQWGDPSPVGCGK